MFLVTYQSIFGKFTQESFEIEIYAKWFVEDLNKNKLIQYVKIEKI